MQEHLAEHGPPPGRMGAGDVAQEGAAGKGKLLRAATPWSQGKPAEAKPVFRPAVLNLS